MSVCQGLLGRNKDKEMINSAPRYLCHFTMYVCVCVFGGKGRDFGEKDDVWTVHCIAVVPFKKFSRGKEKN